MWPELKVYSNSWLGPPKALRHCHLCQHNACDLAGTTPPHAAAAAAATAAVAHHMGRPNIEV